MNRDHTCGELRKEDAGKHVRLAGWVAKRRNLGSIVFIDLRDRYGITQVTFDENHSDLVKDVRNEYVIEIEGTVSVKETPNPRLETGEIEVLADSFKLLSSAKTTPMIIADETDALEEVRPNRHRKAPETTWSLQDSIKEGSMPCLSRRSSINSC